MANVLLAIGKLFVFLLPLHARLAQLDIVLSLLLTAGHTVQRVVGKQGQKKGESCREATLGLWLHGLLIYEAFACAINYLARPSLAFAHLIFINFHSSQRKNQRKTYTKTIFMCVRVCMCVCVCGCLFVCVCVSLSVSVCVPGWLICAGVLSFVSATLSVCPSLLAAHPSLLPSTLLCNPYNPPAVHPLVTSLPTPCLFFPLSIYASANCFMCQDLCLLSCAAALNMFFAMPRPHSHSSYCYTSKREGEGEGSVFCSCFHWLFD